MRTKSIRYYIIDINNKPKSVSEEDHRKWVEENAHKYNCKKTFADGSKKASLTFIGKKEPDKDRIIFQVRTEFWSGGEIVNTPLDIQNFNSYKQALESYEMYLIMNGGFEKETSKTEKGKQIEIKGYIGGSKNEKIIPIDTNEIDTISESSDRTTIWTTRTTIHTKLSFKEVMKLIE